MVVLLHVTPALLGIRAPLPLCCPLLVIIHRLAAALQPLGSSNQMLLSLRSLVLLAPSVLASRSTQSLMQHSSWPMESVTQEQPKAAATPAPRDTSVQTPPRNPRLVAQAITLLEIPLPVLSVQLGPIALPP